MTVIRLGSGALFLHSQTPLPPGLWAAVEGLGRVRSIVGPNRIHHWPILQRKAVFPETEVYLAPRIREQAGRDIDFSGRALDAASGYL